MMTKTHGLLSRYLSTGGCSYTRKLLLPTNTERHERDFINAINAQIEDIVVPLYLKQAQTGLMGVHLTFRAGDKSYEFPNVCGANKVDGKPKADIVFVSVNPKTQVLSDCCYISHKAGRGAEAFQQYGGLSEKAGDVFSRNEEVQSFLRAVHYAVRNKFHGRAAAESGFTAWRRIEDSALKQLVGKSLFGVQWTSGTNIFGEESVHCIMQGTPTLTVVNKNQVSLTCSGHIYPNTTSWCFGNGAHKDHRAVFAATYRTDRNINVIVEANKPALQTKYVRVGIYPMGFVSARGKSIQV